MVEDDSFYFFFFATFKNERRRRQKNESDVIEQWPLDAPGDGLEKVGYWKKLHSYSCRGASERERERQ